MMLDRMEGNAELKTSVHQMLASRRLTHSVLLVGEEGLGAGFAARCIAADYLYPAGGAPAEALLRGECCRAVGKAGKRDSGQIETGIVREAISVEGMGAGGRYLVSQVTAMRSEIFNTSLSAEGRAVLLSHGAHGGPRQGSHRAGGQGHGTGPGRAGGRQLHRRRAAGPLRKRQGRCGSSFAGPPGRGSGGAAGQPPCPGTGPAGPADPAAGRGSQPAAGRMHKIDKN